MSRELPQPSPELHLRAALAWGRVRRHPAYNKEATDCLNSIPRDIREKFSSFLQEYPPDDAERWTLAKADAPLRFPRSRRVIRRFRPWERTLWEFYKGWGICFPIPPSVDAPHPTILAWLAPRPAETWVGQSSHAITMRVNPRAPLNRVLACLKEEVVRVRRLYRIQRGAEETPQVSRLYSTPRECLLRVPLRLRLEATLAQGKALILAERRAHQIRAGDQRERPDQEWRALRAWDLFKEGKRLKIVARTLGCSTDQAWRAWRRAHVMIFEEPYPRRRRAMQQAADFQGHLETCSDCRTKGRLCREGERLLDRETGARPHLDVPSHLRRIPRELVLRHRRRIDPAHHK